MNSAIAPLVRSNLADDLAERIVKMIRSGGYDVGDRLPSIMAMARSFGVGHPTLREALKKLEIVGAVEIKHGSGVFVGRGHESLMVSNPVYQGEVSKDLMLDLVEARIPIEVSSAELAAIHGTEDQFEELEDTLLHAGRNLQNDARLNEANMSFHRGIAVASGNDVLVQVQEVLAGLFEREQRVLLGIHGSRKKDHEEHLGILSALRMRDSELAQELMRAHLEWVREVILRWDPAEFPLS